MAEELTFTSWVRDQAAAAASRSEDGRLIADVSVGLIERALDGRELDSVSSVVEVALAGPADVRGLASNAISRRYPVPDTPDHETAKTPHVEFGDPALPWRFSPETAGPTDPITPWLSLIVVRDSDAEVVINDNHVTFSPAVVADVNAVTLHTFAHVQESSSGVRTARLLSCRAFVDGMLPIDTAMIALVVPTWMMSDSGLILSWTSADPAPILAHWRFRTAPIEGDFRSLSQALRPGDASATTGTSLVDFPTVSVDVEPAAIRGALAPAGSGDEAVATPVLGYIASLRQTLAVDDKGRPIIGLPDIGAPWADVGEAWHGEVNGDPRLRGIASLARNAVNRHQEALVSAAKNTLGAVEEANQRIRSLATGIVAARSLWDRYLPSTASAQLRLFGPAMARIQTGTGTVSQRLRDRATGANLFTSAANRVLRSGPARTSLTEPNANAADAVVAAANRCLSPPDPPRGPLRVTGLLSKQSLTFIRSWAGKNVEPSDIEKLIDVLRKLTFDAAPPDQQRALLDLRNRTVGYLAAGGELSPLIHLLLVILLIKSMDKTPTEELSGPLFEPEVVNCFFEIPLEKNVALLGCLKKRGLFLGDNSALVPPLRSTAQSTPCEPIAVEPLARSLRDALDPGAPIPRAAERTYGTIEGATLNPAFLPIEPCPQIPVNGWTLFKDEGAEWLLPGLGQLADDVVIGLESNQRFVETAMIGLNQQLLSELRWRSFTIDPSCTVIRRWWGRKSRADGTYEDDIQSLNDWATSSFVGEHGVIGSGRDAVVIIKARLIHRYPTTVVYLTPATDAWDRPAPDRDRSDDIYPTFVGMLTADSAFFGFGGQNIASLRSSWLVLEEPPAGYSFRAEAIGANAAEHAEKQFANPTRVLIRGDRIIPGGAR